MNAGKESTMALEPVQLWVAAQTELTLSALLASLMKEVVNGTV